MREILFRGKRKDNGEWIYGDFLKYGDSGKEKSYIRPDFSHMLCAYEVDPETVGQYTNLTDKNGTKIFEGDIVNVKTQCSTFNQYVVKWYERSLSFVMQSLKEPTNSYTMYNYWEFKIIGNIYDSNDLI